MAGSNEIIDFSKDAKELTGILKEQIDVLKKIGETVKTAYKPLPSELQKQLKEQNDIELQTEKLKQQSLRTQKLIEDSRQREIKALQAKEAQERKNLKLHNDFVNAMDRQKASEERRSKAIEQNNRKVLEQNGAYVKLQGTWRQAQQTLANLIITEGNNAKATQDARNEFNKLDAQIKKVDASVKNYSRNVGNYGSAFSGLSSLGGQLAGALGWAGAIATVVQLGKSFYDTNKELQSINMSMKLGARDSEAYNSNLEFLNKTTEKYGLELLTTTQAYNKFYIASKNKLALEDIQLIFDKVSKSASLMGLSVYDQEGIFKALEQMMSKGTVQAEELRGQLGDRLPGAFEIMAKAMGVTTKELGKLMQDGKVLASEVLPKFAIELEKAFGADKVDKIDNITAAENRMKNAWTNFVNEVDGGSGIISKAIKGIYNQISETIDGWNRLLNKASMEDIVAKAGDTAIQKLSERAKKTGEDQKQLAELLYKQNLVLATRYEQDLTKLVKEHQTRRKGSLEGLTTNVEYKRLRANLDKIEAENKAYYNFQLKEKQQFTNDSENETKKLTKAELNALKQAQEERKKAIFESNKLTIQMKIDASRDELLLDAKTEGQRKEIQIKYNEDSKKILKLNYDEELRLAQGVKEKIVLAEIKYNSEIRKLDAESDKLRKEMLNKQYEDALKLANMLEDNDRKNAMKQELIYAKSEQDKINIRLKYIEKEKAYIDEQAKQAIESKKYETNELLIILEEYEQKTRDLDLESKEIIVEQAKKAQEQIKGYLSKFTDMGNFGFSSINVFTTFEENGKSMFENMLENAKDWKQQMAVIVGSVGEVFKDVMSAMGDASKARFDNEIEQLKQSYEISLLFAGDSAEAKIRLEEEFEEKQKELKRKQAKRDKEMAILNAVINTAQGVVSMLATVPWPANLVMAGLVGALGAVQIATIASTPIPEFWTGTDNAPRGWALTQERGAEVITDKHGNVKTYGNNKGAQLTFLESGDKVYKSQQDYINRELNGILTSNNIGYGDIEIVNKGATAEEIDSIFAKHLGSQVKHSISIDERGFTKSISNRNNRQIIKNNAVKF